MLNQFAEKLYRKSQDRFSVDSINMPVSEWVCKNTTLLGRPFSLKGYEFQRQILNDMHPNMDVIKISQVGLTEVSIRKMLAFLKRNDGTSGIFSLPDENMFERISNARIKPIVNNDPVFNTEADKANRVVRSMEMMQFGKSFLYVVAAIESAATSISADIVMNDEVDLSDQQMLGLFGSRLQNSNWKIAQRFSTPSFPSFGIDLNWNASDQHTYVRRCGSCGKHNSPEFTRDFVYIPGLPEDVQLHDILPEHREILHLDQSYIKCQHCHAQLDLSGPGEWVAKYPSRTDARGYRVSPFCTNKLDIQYIVRELWKYQKLEYQRGWWNTVLGLPYSDGTIQIPREDIIACMTNQVNPPALDMLGGIWVGIDMGQTCHITIGRGVGGENPEVVKIYSVHVKDLIAEVTKLCTECNVLGGAVDRHPYEPTAREIFQVSNQKIIPTEYRGQKETNVVMDEFGNFSHAQVNHTMFLDAVATTFRRRKIRVSGYGNNKTVFIEHLRDMVRDEQPDHPAVWKKLTKNDHFFHSTAFMLVAHKLIELEKLKSDAEIRTMPIIGQIVNTGSGKSPGLIGMGAEKRIDKIISTF